MLLSTDRGLFQSSLLTHCHDLIHGFSGRAAGDMRPGTGNRDLFVQSLGLRDRPVFAHQTHGNAVPGDGLVSKARAVAVLTADCVPVLLADPQAHVCAAVHAGWKGTLGGIVKNAIAAMVKENARTERIYAVIGPHIGSCCYTVVKERAERFISTFGTDGSMAFENKGQWFLDLARCNYHQLIETGVAADHIDAPPTCTYCQTSDFFSYRRDGIRSYGEMMAVIGYQTV